MATIRIPSNVRSFFCYFHSLIRREILESDSIDCVNGAVNNINDGGRVNLTNKSYVIQKR